MKTGIKHKVMAILTAVLMVAAMIPVMAAPVFADDEIDDGIPEYTVKLDPGNGAGQQIKIKSSEEGRISTDSNQPNGMFFWWYHTMFYKYPDLPESFGAPDGTKFIGWATDADSSSIDDPGTDYTFIGKNSITLTAQWGATISFYSNDGSDTMNAAKVKMGESCSLPECGFEAPDGQVFKGWNTVPEDTPDNSGIWYYPGDMLTTDKDVTLYARWGDKQIISLCPYDITNSKSGQGGMYMCEGESDSFVVTDSAPNNYTISPDETYSFFAIPSDGYSFVGWYKGEPFSTAENTQNARPYMDWSPVSTNDYFSCKINSDWTLYAVFERTADPGLQNAKDAATAELDAIDKTQYSGDELAAVEKAISDAKTAINNAESIEAVDSALSAAKETIANQKTDAQKNEEAAAAQAEAAPAAPAEILDLPALKITKPKAAKKKLTVRWKKVSKKNLKKISGIQIQVATDPGFTNIVKTATAGKKKISKKIGGLQPKTKYYVRLRAYGATGHYSVWKNKTGKTK